MIWVLYNERTNCLRARVRARLQIANRLHGKAAEWAVLTEITELKLKAHRVHLQLIEAMQRT